MPLDKFLENDIEKVKEIKNYLIEKADTKNYIVFYTVEYWLILYWTNEYEELSKSIKEFNSDVLESYKTQIRPPHDMLSTKLKLKSSENASSLIDMMQDANIDTETKEILVLNFETIIKNDLYQYQDTLNTKADEFLKTYQNTEYKKFVKEFIKYTLVERQGGAAVDICSGYGIFTKKLKDNYTNNIIPIGLGLDVCYQRLELYLRAYIGISTTKKDFEYSTGIFKKGSQTNVYLYEASLGYAILNNDRIKISPFAGIGGIEICAPENDLKKKPELEELSISTFNCMMGVNLDIKLGKRQYLFYPKSDYTFLRIRYAYNTPKFRKKHDISGNMHYITVGIGWFGRGVKRKY